MKIVLIGAKSFLATSIFHHFKKTNPEFRWIFLSSSEFSDHNKDLKFYEFHRYRWPDDSLANEYYVRLFKEASVIIYASGAGIQPMLTVPDEYVDNLNFLEPVRLVKRLEAIGFDGQLITFGSYFEIGNSSITHPLSERELIDEFNPMPNRYSISKRKLTLIHDLYNTLGSNFKWLHLILTNIYGPGENMNRLIPYIIGQLKADSGMRFTSGKQKRQYTYVGDIVLALEKLLQKADGLYHITNEKIITVEQVIGEVLRQSKKIYDCNAPIDFDLDSRRDLSMNYLALSALKVKTDYGITCDTSLSDGVALYFKDGNIK